MIRLIFYQFSYAKKILLGTLPLLIISSLIIGTSLIGIDSASETAINAIQLFQMLIFFGGITLFFLISNTIQLLIDIFKDDYRLWSMLGANRSQLSLLISGQLFLIALIASTIGTLLSYIGIETYYSFLQEMVGKRELPDLTVTVALKTFLGSVLIVPFITAVSGYYYARKQLGNDGSAPKSSFQSYLRIAVKIVTGLLVMVLWGACFKFLFSDTTGNSQSDILQQTSAVLLLLLIHLVMIQLITPKIQLFLLKVMTRICFRESYASIIGKRNVLFKPTYLKNLQASMAMGITLVSGFLLYVQNTYMGSVTDSMREAKFSFLTYMSAPILTIMANVITLSILSSHQDRRELEQLSILGASTRQLVTIRATEALLQSLLLFVVSGLFNVIILFAVRHSVFLIGQQMVAIHSIWFINLMLSGGTFLFYLGTKLFGIISLRLSKYDYR